jgi:acyl carrier protein
MRPLASGEGLALFDAALAGDRAAVVPARFDAATLQGFAASLPPALRGLVRVRAARPVAASAAPAASLVERLRGLPPAERERALLEVVRREVGTVLGMGGSGGLDPLRPLQELGLDSLMAVELRNALGAALGATLPPTLLFDYPTVNAVAGLLAQKIPTMSKEPVAQPARDERERDALVAEIQELSESEVEAAIARELGTLGK